MDGFLTNVKIESENLFKQKLYNEKSSGLISVKLVLVVYNPTYFWI